MLDEDENKIWVGANDGKIYRLSMDELDELRWVSVDEMETLDFSEADQAIKKVKETY